MKDQHHWLDGGRSALLKNRPVGGRDVWIVKANGNDQQNLTDTPTFKDRLAVAAADNGVFGHGPR